MVTTVTELSDSAGRLENNFNTTTTTATGHPSQEENSVKVPGGEVLGAEAKDAAQEMIEHTQMISASADTITKEMSISQAEQVLARLGFDVDGLDSSMLTQMASRGGHRAAIEQVLKENQPAVA